MIASEARRGDRSAAEGPSIDSAVLHADQIPGPGDSQASPSKDYSRRDRKKLAALMRRAAWIEKRARERPVTVNAFDLQELGALRWALEAIVAARGALPEELEANRASIWPT